MTIPADGRVVADYTDRSGKARETLQRIKAAKAKAAAEKGLSKDAADGEEGDGVDKGHAIAAADQSAITGESLAVDKHIDDFVFYTT